MGIETIAGAINLNEPQMSYNSTVNAQAQAVEQNAKAREMRPVENIADSAKPKEGAQNPTTTETVIDDENVVVFTRYDSEGKEINKVPPGYDEMG